MTLLGHIWLNHIWLKSYLSNNNNNNNDGSWFNPIFTGGRGNYANYEFTSQIQFYTFAEEIPPRSTLFFLNIPGSNNSFHVLFMHHFNFAGILIFTFFFGKGCVLRHFNYVVRAKLPFSLNFNFKSAKFLMLQNSFTIKKILKKIHKTYICFVHYINPLLESMKRSLKIFHPQP